MIDLLVNSCDHFQLTHSDVPGARLHTRLWPQIRIKSQTRAGIRTRNNYFLSVKIVSFVFVFFLFFFFHLFTIENFLVP